MSNADVIKFLKSKEVSEMFDKYAITKVYVFWSYARWEATNDSDLDLMIDWDNNIYKMTLFDYIDIEKYFQEKIWVKKVDIWTKRSINKHIYPYIEKDLLQIKY